jgi:hypothetical protein
MIPTRAAPVAEHPAGAAGRWLRRLVGLICLAILLVSTPASPPAEGAEEPSLQDEGLERQQLLVLREAFQLVNTVGNEVWPGWVRSPMTVVIIHDDREFLFNAPPEWIPTGGFEAIEQTFIGQPIYRRERTLPQALRAAFPIAGLPAAVVGAWRPTEESPNEWAVTLVHEWFHVLQMTRGEDSKVGDLELDGGVYPSLQLDYPFAYGDRDIGHAIHLLGSALYDFWSRSRTLPRAMQRTFVAETSWAALQNLETIVTLKYGEDAYNYFRYQTWKEGVARYTQVRVSLLAADFEDSGRFYQQPGFAALQGSMTYARLWEEVTRTNYWLMRTSSGDQGGDPTSFYGIGHGLAELLDAINPTWKERYFDDGVWLDDLVAEAMDSSAVADR